jgi:hypothetical protein
LPHLYSLPVELAYEWTFATWDKLPFTCSYLPGKHPAWALALGLLGLLAGLPALSWALVLALHSPLAYVATMAAILAVWRRVHLERGLTWGRLPLRYEDSPEPAIHGLNLLG